jgi:hypothetical protein
MAYLIARRLSAGDEEGCWLARSRDARVTECDEEQLRLTIAH